MNLGITTITASLNGVSGNTKVTATDQIGFVFHDRYCDFDTGMALTMYRMNETSGMPDS
jgi:hypothetical protein